MADLELSGGLQAVINGVDPKTGSGYAGGIHGDLIQLYADDGTPNGSISRDALMSCVKDSLGTLLNQAGADLGTSLAKIPALNSGGTLGSATVANLASVLGVDKRFEFVDMGLPSGTLWASKNLGADTITDYGAYFSWGNVQGQKPNGSTFPQTWGSGNDTEPYVSSEGAALSGDIPLNLDAANYYLGGKAKMPTKDQFVELFNSSYTTNEWTTLHGVAGRLVTSKANGNTIFFPAAGYGNGTSLYLAGSYGLYWSRSLQSSSNGYRLSFNSSSVNPQDNNLRYLGFSVRAVL